MSNLNERSDSYETLDIIEDIKGSGQEKRMSTTGRCARSNSYAMGLDNPVAVEDVINSNLLSPTTTFTSLRNGEVPVLKPIHAVQRYSLSSRRTKGSIGQLILTNSRLKFLNYSEDGKINANLSHHPTRFPPFDFHSFLDESSLGSLTEFDEDIDLMMIFSIKSGPFNNIMSSTTMNSSMPLTTSSTSSTSHIILRIDCNDFRCIEFLLKSNEESKVLIDSLDKLYNKQFSPQLSSSSSNNNQNDYHSNHVPLLWTLLWSRYGTQFETSRSAKCSNCITRLNLDTFPATKDVPSFDQLESIYSRVIESCHTYSSTRTFISSTGKWLKVVSKIMKIVDQVVHHLSTSDTRPFHPDQVEVESESLDLLLLKPVIISLVQIVLSPKSRTINGLEKLIFKQFTIDSVSSVTFTNFKIYRVNPSGVGSKTNFRKRYPNHIIFTLFIDSLNQILTFKDHNFKQFEFNSLFLIRLFDLQFVPSTPSSNVTWTCYDSVDDSTSSSLSTTSKLTMSATSSAAKINTFINNTLSGGKSSSLIPLPQNYKQINDDYELQNNRIRKQNQRHSISSPLHGLGCGYKESNNHENSIPVSFAAIGAPSTHSLLFLKNPFHSPSSRSLPEIPTSIAQITLFEGLFLRWHFVGKTLETSKPFNLHEIGPRVAVFDHNMRTSSHVCYYHRFFPLIQVMTFDYLIFGPTFCNEDCNFEESYQETTL